MPQGQVSTDVNRQPVSIGDTPIFADVYIGGVTAPLSLISGSVAVSADTSLSTVASTNLSASTSRVTSLSSVLSVTTSTANSG